MYKEGIRQRLENVNAELVISLFQDSYYPVFFIGVPHCSNDSRRGLRDSLENNNVVAVVHGTSQLTSMITFKPEFSLLLKEQGEFLINTVDFHFPSLYLTEIIMLTKENEEAYQHNKQNAQLFLKNALFNFNNKDYTLTAFMLHQALEHALTSLAIEYSGYDLATHSIERLRKYVLPHCNELGIIFNFDDPEDIRLFRLLKSSYVGARYDPSYAIKPEDCYGLLERVKRVLELIN